MDGDEHGAPHRRLREAAKQIELASERLETTDTDIEQLQGNARTLCALADAIEGGLVGYR